MQNRRQLQVAHLLQEVFGTMLIRDLKNYTMGAFVTLTKVNVTSDLSLARFNMSVLGFENKQLIIDNFNLNKSEIRKIFGNAMRNDLRRIPEMEFYLDNTLDYVENIDSILKKIKEDEI
jgi:ribosome-binding factor A